MPSSPSNPSGAPRPAVNPSANVTVASVTSPKPVPARGAVRFIGDLPGKYTLTSRRPDTAPHKVEVFACRSRSISTALAVLDAPVVGEIGDLVAMHLETLGLMQGRIARRLPGGFVAEIDTKPAEEAALSDRLAWLKQNHGLNAANDRREHRRWLPRNPKSHLTFRDGSSVACFIIDVSASGVAVSANVIPVVGAEIAVGNIQGTLIRFLPVGFAIQFNELQEPKQIEAKLAAMPAP